MRLTLTPRAIWFSRIAGSGLVAGLLWFVCHVYRVVGVLGAFYALTLLGSAFTLGYMRASHVWRTGLTSELERLGRLTQKLEDRTKETRGPMKLYLSRNAETPDGPYGGTYALTSYLPTAPPSKSQPLVWCYWADDGKNVRLPLSTGDAEKLEKQMGRHIARGEVLDLTTGDVTHIRDAKRLELKEA